MSPAFWNPNSNHRQKQTSCNSESIQKKHPLPHFCKPRRRSFLDFSLLWPPTECDSPHRAKIAAMLSGPSRSSDLILLISRSPLPHDKGVALVAVNVDNERSNATKHFLCVTVANGEDPSVIPTHAPLTGSSKFRGWRIPCLLLQMQTSRLMHG